MFKLRRHSCGYRSKPSAFPRKPTKSGFLFARAVIEALEPRMLLSTYNVTNGTDGPNAATTVGTLRWAVAQGFDVVNMSLE